MQKFAYDFVKSLHFLFLTIVTLFASDKNQIFEFTYRSFLYINSDLLEIEQCIKGLLL